MLDLKKLSYQELTEAYVKAFMAWRDTSWYGEKEKQAYRTIQGLMSERFHQL